MHDEGSDDCPVYEERDKRANTLSEWGHICRKRMCKSARWAIRYRVNRLKGEAR